MGALQNRVVLQLMVALGVLAEEHPAQLAWLAKYLRTGRTPEGDEVWVEELALQFEDSAQALPEFVLDGFLESEQRRAVAAVADQLSFMRDASRAHLWRAEALASGSEWAEVRTRARAALDALKRS